MTLKELKRKTLVLIEEYNANKSSLTDDIDIEAKFNDVANQNMFEICRIKKLPKYVEMEVKKGDIITLEDIEGEVGYSIYQVGLIGNVECETKASGTVFKMLESGTAEIDVFVYPEAITDKTKDSYEFELTPDVMEILPYGIAADILSTDVSTGYGKIYRDIYEMKLNRLDPRYHMPSITIEGGASI